MGLMDKFKNLFTDEEVIEDEEIETVEIKEVKKEDDHKLPTFMREKIEKEEKEKEKEKSVKISNSDFSDIEIKKELKLESIMEKPDVDVVSNVVEEKNTFKFPIDLTDNDFVEKRSRQSIHHSKIEEEKPKIKVEPEKEMVRKVASIKNEPKVAELYKDKREEKEKEKAKKFRATPIISPIYGVLDKNYTPDDMEKTEVRNLEEKRHSKNVDFDSVRKKAYGSLSEEIKENLMCENCEYLKEAKECKERHNKRYKSEKKYSDGLLYDVLEEDRCESYRSDITLDEATENYYDYGVEYEKVPTNYENDSYVEEVYEESTYIDEPVIKEEVKIVRHDEEVRKKNEIPPVKSSINLLSTSKKSMGDEVVEPKKKEENLELTDDLFNLIDSMYDERNENK